MVRQQSEGQSWLLRRIYTFRAFKELEDCMAVIIMDVNSVATVSGVSTQTTHCDLIVQRIFCGGTAMVVDRRSGHKQASVVFGGPESTAGKLSCAWIVRLFRVVPVVEGEHFTYWETVCVHSTFSQNAMRCELEV